MKPVAVKYQKQTCRMISLIDLWSAYQLTYADNFIDLKAISQKDFPSFGSIKMYVHYRIIFNQDIWMESSNSDLLVDQCTYQIDLVQLVYTYRSLVLPLIYWDRHKMVVIFQTTVSSAFSWMTICEIRLKCHWNMFLRVQSTILQHWIRQWLGADQATSQYLN